MERMRKNEWISTDLIEVQIAECVTIADVARLERDVRE
jgi:hypothetical protein